MSEGYLGNDFTVAHNGVEFCDDFSHASDRGDHFFLSSSF
jgi:hypothetical protein